MQNRTCIRASAIFVHYRCVLEVLHVLRYQNIRTVWLLGWLYVQHDIEIVQKSLAAFSESLHTASRLHSSKMKTSFAVRLQTEMNTHRGYVRQIEIKIARELNGLNRINSIQKLPGSCGLNCTWDTIRLNLIDFAPAPNVCQTNKTIEILQYKLLSEH